MWTMWVARSEWILLHVLRRNKPEESNEERCVVKSPETDAKCQGLDAYIKLMLKGNKRGFVNAPTLKDLQPIDCERVVFERLALWQNQSSLASIELQKERLP